MESVWPCAILRTSPRQTFKALREIPASRGAVAISGTDICFPLLKKTGTANMIRLPVALQVQKRRFSLIALTLAGSAIFEIRPFAMRQRFVPLVAIVPA